MAMAQLFLLGTLLLLSLLVGLSGEILCPCHCLGLLVADHVVRAFLTFYIQDANGP